MFLDSDLNTSSQMKVPSANDLPQPLICILGHEFCFKKTINVICLLQGYVCKNLSVQKSSSLHTTLGHYLVLKGVY